MIVVSGAGDKLIVTLSADEPSEIRETIESLMGCRFNPKTNVYFVPVHDFPLLREKIQRLGHSGQREMDDEAWRLIRDYEERLRLNDVIRDGALNDEIASETTELLKSRAWTDQVADVRFCLRHQKAGIFHEMGCVDGSAEVTVTRAGVARRMSLRHLHQKFHGEKTNGKSWDGSIPTHVRSLCGGELRRHRVEDVLDKGVRPVVRLTLRSGKVLRLTPDHEVCVGPGRFVRADRLVAGDVVLTNGVPACRACGQKPAWRKATGECRSCSRRGPKNSNFKGGKFVDGDGYVRVTGRHDHPRANATGQVYEHILVMEQHLGRSVPRREVVHHRNEIRHDNRIENLELLPDASAHATKHGRDGGYLRMEGGRAGTGGTVRFLPLEDRVVSVVPDGSTRVYDVVCADPHRNFVANGIVVHNCGKTLVLLATFAVLRRRGLARYGLVVCPNTVKATWLRQTAQHTRLTAQEIGNGSAEIARRLQRLQDNRPDLIVTHYEALRDPQVQRALVRMPFDVVIADEVHLIKNIQTDRAQAMFATLAQIRPSVSLVEVEVELPDGTTTTAVMPAGVQPGQEIDFL